MVESNDENSQFQILFFMTHYGQQSACNSSCSSIENGQNDCLVTQPNDANLRNSVEEKTLFKLTINLKCLGFRICYSGIICFNRKSHYMIDELLFLK